MATLRCSGADTESPREKTVAVDEVDAANTAAGKLPHDICLKNFCNGNLPEAHVGLKNELVTWR